ncbi:MAG: alpha/beta hydrolase [Pyrinomonadaceae bacterium]
MTPNESVQTSIGHGYAEVNGIRLHYAEAGTGTDLVILLHGFPEYWYSWRHQLMALGKSFHVVAPDMRGYNLSDKPPQVEDYRIEVLVDDVVGLIDYFGASKAAVVGHDWGAGVAWAVAQRHPDRVSKLAVLQVPPAAAWRANITLGQLLRSWYMLFFQLPRIPEWAIGRNRFAALDKTFKETVARKGSFTDEDIARYKEALGQPGALSGAINYYRANVRQLISSRPSSGSREPDSALQGESLSRAHGRVRVPTLFIYGEQDFAILPATVRNVEKYIDAPYREVRIAASGHWVQNEAAEEVNAALIEFLR